MNDTITTGKSAIPQPVSRSFMDAIKSDNYLCPAVQFQYHTEGDFVVPRESSGIVLTEQDFNELCFELRRFYAAVTSEQIAEENEAVRESWRQEQKQSLISARKLTFGYVYLLEAEGGVYKIGKAKNIDNRLAQITPRLPFSVEVIHWIESEDYTRAEQFMHSKFAARREQGEWFRLNKGDVAYIKAIETISAKGVLNE